MTLRLENSRNKSDKLYDTYFNIDDYIDNDDELSKYDIERLQSAYKRWSHREIRIAVSKFNHFHNYDYDLKKFKDGAMSNLVPSPKDIIKVRSTSAGISFWACSNIHLIVK